MPKKSIFLIIGAILLNGCINNEESPYTLAKVERNDIIQTVSVTGTIETDTKIDLRFQKAGQIEEILIEEGDYVEKGETLAVLEGQDLIIKRNEIQANLEFAQAKLNQKLAGNTQEDIEIARTNVLSAEITLENAKSTLQNTRNIVEQETQKANLAVSATEKTLRSTQTKLENAEKTLADTQKTYQQDIDESYADSRVFSKSLPVTFNSALEEADKILGVDNEEVNDDFQTNLMAHSHMDFNKAQQNYGYAKISFRRWKEKLAQITKESTEEEIDQIIEEAEEVLGKFRTVLDDTYTLLENALTGASLTQAALASKKTSLSVEQTSIETAIDSLETYKQAINNAVLTKETKSNDADRNIDIAKNTVIEAEIALDQAKQTVDKTQTEGNKKINDAENTVRNAEAGTENAKANLALKEAFPREVDVASLRAEVKKAEAALDLANYEVSQLSITAPANGIITKINFDIGENISVQDTFLILITKEFHTVANVSETDIAKVKLKDKVEMTLDAFGPDRKFIGTITEIDPAETVVQGVIYYQIKVLFEGESQGIKPGMTANLDIITAQTANVLTIPIRAVKYREDEKYVKVLEGEEEKEVIIETGIEGDIMIEITSGLQEGDEVITFVKEE